MYSTIFGCTNRNKIIDVDRTLDVFFDFSADDFLQKYNDQNQNDEKTNTIGSTA